VSDRLRIALGDALEVLIDHRGKTPSKLGGGWADSGVRVVSAINIKERRVDSENLRFVTEEIYERWMPVKVQAGDVLLTSEAPLGEVAYLADESPVCLGQRIFGLRGKSDVLDGRFLYYLLGWGEPRVELLGRATGTTVSGIRQAELVKVQLHLPPLSEQRAIAGVLGALDDKIESNRRLVRCSTGFIQASFSAEFDKFDLSLVLENIADVTDCLHSKKPERAIAGAQLLQLSNIGDDGVLDPSNHFPISEEDYQNWTRNMELTHGDVVITNVGRVGAIARIPRGVRAALGRNMTGVRAKRPGDDVFVAAALLDSRVRSAMFGLVDSGTIMDALNVYAIRRIQLPDADVFLRDRFASLVGLILERAEAAVRESIEIASMRDALLPELLSGRLRVRDAERAVEEVV
jgi:type I restriction enzyme S subunit